MDYASEDVITFRISPDRNEGKPEVKQALFGKVEVRLSALPGVRMIADEFSTSDLLGRASSAKGAACATQLRNLVMREVGGRCDSP